MFDIDIDENGEIDDRNKSERLSNPTPNMTKVYEKVWSTAHLSGGMSMS